MDCICSMCGRKKYKPPFEDKRTVPDMCCQCEKLQDIFIEKRLGEKKDSGKRRRKGE